MCCSEIGTPPAPGRAKSYRGTGSSPHRHSGAKCPLPTKSAGGKEYEYIVVDDYSRAAYTRPLRLKPNAPEAFKIFKAAAENESQKRMREVMTDNARELSMGGMRQTGEKEGIKLHTFVRYSPESNGVAECTIGAFTNAVRALLHDSGFPQVIWAETYNAATYVHNRTPTRALGGRPHTRNRTFHICTHLERRAPLSSRRNG